MYVRASQYMVTRRARFRAIDNTLGVDGYVNLKYGTILQRDGDYVLLDGRQLCVWRSQVACDYLTQNDDGRAEERRKLCDAILKILVTPKNETESQNQRRQAKWDKVWEDETCNKYRHPDNADVFLWDAPFYHAPIEDLEYILNLVGGKVK